MGNDEAMEKRLKVLIEANRPENRSQWALQCKKEGRKVIGILDMYVPEEVIAAAGMLPWRITGTWEEATPRASVYRPEMTCRYCSHVLESVIRGEIDFLDGVFVTSLDDDFKRLWDVLHYLQKPKFTYILYAPHGISKTTRRMWNESILDLKKTIEKWAGVRISDENLIKQIEIYNRMRALLRRVYELRKKDVPGLTGAEALGITTAARVMPREEFNQELEAILPYLESRTAKFKQVQPRLLMSSEYLDHPGYIELVESCGASVVMDEFDTGAKYFWQSIDSPLDNPWEALAKRYLERPGTSRMADWGDQIAQVKRWVKDFKAQGVAELRQLYSLPLDYRFFIMKKKMAEAGIPYISLSREYHLAQVGMLRTRIEAFIEMIKGT